MPKSGAFGESCQVPLGGRPSLAANGAEVAVLNLMELMELTDIIAGRQASATVQPGTEGVLFTPSAHACTLHFEPDVGMDDHSYVTMCLI